MRGYQRSDIPIFIPVNDKVGRNDFLTLKSDSVSSDRLSDFKPTQSPTADSQQKFQTHSPTQSPTTDSAYKTQPTNRLSSDKKYIFKSSIFFHDYKLAEFISVHILPLEIE